MLWVLFVVVVVAWTCATTPFMIWSSVGKVLGATWRARGVSWWVKLRLFSFVGKDLLLLPLETALWYLDYLIWPKCRLAQIKKPVFIISQPRNGTTFLHRTLASDEKNFFALSYLEWRYPYISVWWLLDHLGLRSFVGKLCYWPRSRYGRLANKMHPHYYSDFEEHGIFLEEKFYSHYFVFRRFPFPEVLPVANVSLFSEQHQNKMLEGLLSTIQKVAYYRGAGRCWITKENECVDFYKLLLRNFPDARLLFLIRNLGDSLQSYDRLSSVSTRAKTGINPYSVLGWSEANGNFRLEELRKFQALHGEASRLHYAHATVEYDSVVFDLKDTVREIYGAFGLSISDEYAKVLDDLATKQAVRDRGY